MLLTLKNGKAYIGILWKYPEHPKSRYESQTISIIPLRSGYREKEKNEYYGLPIIHIKNLILIIWR